MRRFEPLLQVDHPPKRRWALWRRRQVLLPTWKGCLLSLGVFAALLLLFALTIHGFLAMSNGKPGGALVIEGWSNDSTFRAAMRELGTNRYDHLYITGGPIPWGAPLNEYKSYAGRGMAVIAALGFATNQVSAVPAPAVRQDRTYTSAVTLREHLVRHGVRGGPVHLITEDAHARRSRLLFQKALGPDFTVTVTAVPTLEYDPKRWWRSSSGVRTILGETIAFLYVRIFFAP